MPDDMTYISVQSRTNGRRGSTNPRLLCLIGDVGQQICVSYIWTTISVTKLLSTTVSVSDANEYKIHYTKLTHNSHRYHIAHIIYT